MTGCRVIARFDTAAALASAAHTARHRGWRGVEAYTPFPVPAVAEALAYRERWLPVLALIAALASAVGFYLLQWYSGTIDYPFVLGGKPPNSWPAFLLVTFEMGILAAVLVAVIVMVGANGLPKLYHPAFEWEEFERASGDAFFLLVTVADSDEAGRVEATLRRSGAQSMERLAP